MGVALQSHTIDQKHKWTPCDAYVGAIARNVALTKDVFQAPLKHDPMAYNDIVSTKQQPGYWSPQACGINAPTLDLQPMRDCKDNMGTMPHSWLGGTTCSCSYCCYGVAVAMLCFVLLRL